MRWLPWVVLLAPCVLVTGSTCALIPTVQTDCSESRPCAAGSVCDIAQSRCVPVDMQVAADQSDPPPECAGESDCTGGRACSNHHCLPCTAHDDCLGGVCADSGLGLAKLGCLPEGDVLFVGHSTDYPSCASGAGTRASPLCLDTNTLGRASDGQKVVRVLGSANLYPALPAAFVSGRSLTLVGPGPAAQPPAVFAAPAATAFTVSGATTRLTLDGIVAKTSQYAISCTTGASITLRRSTLTENPGVACTVNGCTLQIERTLFSNNGRALYVVGSTAYNIRNSIFANNGSSASDSAVIIDDGDGSFVYNTFVGNTARSGVPGGLTCINAPRDVYNCLFFGNSGTQADRCALHNLAVGPSASLSKFVFVGFDQQQYALVDTLESRATIVDQAGSTDVPAVQAVVDDFLGLPRPRGAAPDIGAYELQ